MDAKSASVDLGKVEFHHFVRQPDVDPEPSPRPKITSTKSPTRRRASRSRRERGLSPLSVPTTRAHHRGMETPSKSCATCFHYAAHFSLDKPRRQSDGWCCVSLPDGGHRAVNRDEVCSDWVSYPLFSGFLP